MLDELPTIFADLHQADVDAALRAFKVLEVDAGVALIEEGDVDPSLVVVQRGTLEVGKRADVNVIDFEGLHLPVPEYVNDFPNGAGRYVQGSSGYDYTLVNGHVFMDHGEHTGVLAGRMLRSN